MATPSTNTLTDKAIDALSRALAKLKFQVERLESAIRRTDTTNMADVAKLFKNTHNETAPAFAVMGVTGGNRSQLEPYLTITKPSTTFRRRYVVNGPQPVPANGYGYCYERGSVEVLYDSGTPAVGEGWGPKPDQWTLSKFYPETATVAGITNPTSKTMLAEWKTITECWGNVTTAVSQGGTGNVALYAGTFGSESSIGITLTGVGNPTADLTLHDKVNVGWVNGQPEMYPREC